MVFVDCGMHCCGFYLLMISQSKFAILSLLGSFSMIAKLVKINKLNNESLIALTTIASSALVITKQTLVACTLKI